MLSKRVSEPVKDLAHGEPGERDLYSQGPAQVCYDSITGSHETTIDVAGVEATVVLLGLTLKMLQDVPSDDGLTGPSLTIGEKVRDSIPS